MNRLSESSRWFLFGVVVTLAVIGFNYFIWHVEEWLTDWQTPDFDRPGGYFDTQDDLELPTLMGSDNDMEGNFQAYLEFPASARPSGAYIYIWGVRPVYDPEVNEIFFYDFELMFDTQTGELFSGSWSGQTQEEKDRLEAVFFSIYNQVETQ